MLKIREYVKAKDLEEAYQLNQKNHSRCKGKKHCKRWRGLVQKTVQESGDQRQSQRRNKRIHRENRDLMVTNKVLIC